MRNSNRSNPAFSASLSYKVSCQIAACGTPKQIAEHIRTRVDGLADTVCLYQPGPIALDALAAIVDELS